MTSEELGERKCWATCSGGKEGWLLKVHEAVPSFYASRSRYHTLPLANPTGLTFCLILQHVLSTVYCVCCRRWEPPLYQAKSSNSDRSLEVRPSSPPRSNSKSNSPPSKKVQQNLTFAQTHQAPRQPHQRLSRTSRRLQHHIKPILVPVALPYTAAVTQFTHSLGTSRPRAVAVLDSAPSTSSA